MSMIADKIGIKKPSLYKHFSSKDEIVEAMYQFLREQSKKNANIKPVDFSQLFQGKKRKEYRSFGVFAGIALGMMLVGALGMNIVPKEYFGVVERFSVFATVGYNAVLGVQLFRMDFNYADTVDMDKKMR